MLLILILVLKELGEPLKHSFQPIPEDLVREIVLSLDGFKATPVRDISCRYSEIYGSHTSSFYN